MAADKEIMRALDTLRLDRPGRVYGMAAQVADVGENLGNQLIGALMTLATTYREEAELWSRSGAKGWKSAEAEATLIAQRIDEVAAQLDNAGGGAALSVSEPFVPTDAATTHERLDDFVNGAVAAGKGTLRPPPMSAVQFSEPLDIGGTAVALAERPVSDGVEAYLKGEVDTLPGLAEALVPNSITDYCSDCDHDTHRCYGCGEPVEHGKYACAQCEIIHAPEAERIDHPALAPEPITVTVVDNPRVDMTSGDWNAPTMPKTWESDTLTADGHRPPGLPQAPTLGQPGDMGTGYSHSYIPAGGRRVTYADLLTPVPAASLPPHLSHSQTKTSATAPRNTASSASSCSRRFRSGPTSAARPSTPPSRRSSARSAACRPSVPTVSTGRATTSSSSWKHHFAEVIAATQAVSTVPQSMWRSSRKGAEGEAWWRVNGPLMLRRYLDARPADVTITIDSGGTPAIEWEVTAVTCRRPTARSRSRRSSTA
jgi:hypothetical protein